MKKIITLILLSLITVLLFGCEIVFDLNVGGNHTGNPNARYEGCIAFDTYSELIEAWSLRVSNSDGSYEKYYSFDGDFGEGYKTVYYFSAPNAWIVPTTDKEEYFSKVDDPYFTTYVFYTAEGYCEVEYKEDINAHKNLFAEIPDKYYEYEKYPCIRITKAGSLEDTEIIEVEDVSLIVLESTLKNVHTFIYNFSYNGTAAFKIESCKELLQDDISELLEHIIVLK